MTKSLQNNDFLKRSGRFFLFPDTFEKLKCLETGEMTKSLEYGKCPETGKQQNPLTTESVCLETGKS